MQDSFLRMAKRLKELKSTYQTPYLLRAVMQNQTKKIEHWVFCGQTVFGPGVQTGADSSNLASLPVWRNYLAASHISGNHLSAGLAIV